MYLNTLSIDLNTLLDPLLHQLPINYKNMDYILPWTINRVNKDDFILNLDDLKELEGLEGLENLEQEQPEEEEAEEDQVNFIPLKTYREKKKENLMIYHHHQLLNLLKNIKKIKKKIFPYQFMIFFDQLVLKNDDVVSVPVKEKEKKKTLKKTLKKDF